MDGWLVVKSAIVHDVGPNGEGDLPVGEHCTHWQLESSQPRLTLSGPGWEPPGHPCSQAYRPLRFSAHKTRPLLQIFASISLHSPAELPLAWKKHKSEEEEAVMLCWEEEEEGLREDWRNFYRLPFFKTNLFYSLWSTLLVCLTNQRWIVSFSFVSEIFLPSLIKLGLLRRPSANPPNFPFFQKPIF